MPAVGTREVCARCGQTVWLRQFGTTGYTDRDHPRAPVFNWLTRKTAKPTVTRNRVSCIPTPGYQFGYHCPKGCLHTYYGESS